MESFQQSFPTLSFPPLPERGDFDLRDVLESPYFFNWSDVLGFSSSEPQATPCFVLHLIILSTSECTIGKRAEFYQRNKKSRQGVGAVQFVYILWKTFMAWRLQYCCKILCNLVTLVQLHVILERFTNRGKLPLLKSFFR